MGLFPSIRQAKQETYQGKLKYLVGDTYVLFNFKHIITQKNSVVNMREYLSFDDGTSDCEVLAAYVQDLLEKAGPYAKLDRLSYASICTKEAFSKHMSIECREALTNEVKLYCRCPSRETVKELLMANKAGLLYHKKEVEEKLLTNVYAFDSSSYYSSLLFNAEYPIGRLLRYKYTDEAAHQVIAQGKWFLIHGRCKEPVNYKYNILRPYSKAAGVVAPCDDGYYHYSIAPYDWLLIKDLFNVDILRDPDIEWTSLVVCTEIGRLNNEYLKLILDVYNRKEAANNLGERQYYKDALNMMLGKSYPRTLIETEDLLHWYHRPEHYFCPQFGVHMISLARYTTMKLAKQVGINNVVSIVTDCITSTSPDLIRVMNEHNNRVKNSILKYGFNTEIGQWKPEHRSFMVYFRSGTYVFENYSGKVKPVITGCRDASSMVNSFSDIFKDNYLPKGLIVKRGNYFYDEPFPLWSSDENRLKAQEDYKDEMEKLNQGVQTWKEQS